MEELKNVVTLEKNAEKKITQKKKIEEGAINKKPKIQSLEELKRAKEILDTARTAVIEKYPPDEQSEVQNKAEETPVISTVEKPKSKKNKLATKIVNFFTEDVGDAPMDMNYLDEEKPKKEEVTTFPEQENIIVTEQPVLMEMSMFAVPKFVKEGFNNIVSKASNFFNKKSTEKPIAQGQSGNTTVENNTEIEDVVAEVIETKVNSGSKNKEKGNGKNNVNAPEAKKATKKPESGKIVVENEDKVKEAGEVDPENFDEFLTPSNKGFFGKMPYGVKSFMSGLYKGINKIPVVNRLVAKVEIAYNQKWIDVKEEKSVNLKGKMDELSQKIGTFEEAKQRMMSRAEKLRVNGDPSYASMLLEAQRIERKQIKMANAKDVLQSRIESRENQIKLYANKRDTVADKMIENYDKKLSPIEAKLQKNEGVRDRLNLFIAGIEAEHESKLEEFKNLKKEMDEYVADAKTTGTSERRALRSKFIESRRKMIEIGLERIEYEKRRMEEEKIKINNKIAKTDEKANPYRDRRNEFVRVKANRPIKIDLEERVNLINNQTTENTASHTRNDQAYSGYASYYPDTSSTQESNDRQKLVNLIPEYNKWVAKESSDVELLINEKDLFRIVSKEISALTKEKLVGIIKSYYNMKKIPERKYLPLLTKIK